MNRPKQLSAQDNRDRKNSAEMLRASGILDAPNAATIDAMKEAEDETARTTVEMSNYDSFLKSLEE